MKKFSEDKFQLKSRLSPEEIFSRLKLRTQLSHSLIMEFTNKDFIGKIEPGSFEIIDSSVFIPFGAACTVRGTISPSSTITVTTTLHKVFRILFMIWLILISSIYLISWIMDPSWWGILAFFIALPFCALPFRLFLHVMYVLARNSAMTKLRGVLEVVN